jgi:hypothetical protein
MPKRLTMSALRTRALQQADLDTDAAFASTALVNSMISAQYGDLYEVVSAAARRYFEYSTSITTTGLSYIAEPADHMSTIDTIERVINSTTGRMRRLRRIMPQERAMWSGKTGHARRWEMVDDRINLYPTPPSGDVYVLRYIAQPPDLETFGDSDVVDVVVPAGEDFMIWGCVVRFLSRIKSDVSFAMEERERARERLTEWAQLREFNDPHTIVVDYDDDDGPYRDGEYWYDR